MAHLRKKVNLCLVTFFAIFCHMCNRLRQIILFRLFISSLIFGTPLQTVSIIFDRSSNNCFEMKCCFTSKQRKRRKKSSRIKNWQFDQNRNRCCSCCRTTVWPDWAILRVNGNKFDFESIPKRMVSFWAIYKMIILCKNYCFHYLGNIWKHLGYL